MLRMTREKQWTINPNYGITNSFIKHYDILKKNRNKFIYILMMLNY